MTYAGMVDSGPSWDGNVGFAPSLVGMAQTCHQLWDFLDLRVSQDSLTSITEHKICNLRSLKETMSVGFNRTILHCPPQSRRSEFDWRTVSQSVGDPFTPPRVTRKGHSF